MSQKHSIHDELTEPLIQQLQKFVEAPLETNYDTNLIELGLDSLKIMRLVSDWRRSGVDITFAQLVEQPTVSNWQILLRSNIKQTQSKQEAKSNAIEQHPEYSETEGTCEFDLTDVQYAYWIGRQEERELGGVGCHAYVEIDGENINPALLENAWCILVKHHSMLRACFTEDGKQWINEEFAPPKLKVHDLQTLSEEELKQYLIKIRTRLSHRKLEIESAQVMGLELALLSNNKNRIFFDVDLLVADVQSLHIILRDLATIYQGKKELSVDPNWRFSRYLFIEEKRKKNLIEKDKAYWHARLKSLPLGPQLPLAIDPKTINKPVFSRREFLLNQDKWESIKKFAAHHQVTPAMVLVTSYAEVLARWSSELSFSLNLPLFDRQTNHLGIEDVVSDFTNLLLLQCDFHQSMSFSERVKGIQKQFHSDCAHLSYSAVNLQREMNKQGLVDGVAAPVVFACNLGTPLLADNCRKIFGDLNYMVSQTPQVWLDHQVYEEPNGLLLAWDAVDAFWSWYFRM